MKRHQETTEREGGGVKMEGGAMFEETKKPEAEQKDKSEVRRLNNYLVSHRGLLDTRVNAY